MGHSLTARNQFYADAIDRRLKKTPGIPKHATVALYHIVSAHDLLHAHFSVVIAKYGVSVAGWNMLNLLCTSESGARPMHELSELMLVSRQNITQLVDGLEKKKLVVRQTSKEDGRVKNVEVTKAGRDLVDRAQRPHFDEIRAVFADLRDPEVELLCDYLVRIQERILKLRAEREKP
ncbi:MAG: MarR family transcriptional regulator [Polyangiaceae bacterium]